ncbi:MAG: DUF2073 domain-containing protein [Nanoarchaeota archaeon]
MIKKSKFKGLSLHVIPYSEIRDLSIGERVKKVLKLILGSRIVIIQGRLRPEEEARLIEDTMAMVEHIKNFKGIELAVIEPNMKEENLLIRMKHGLAKRLVGESSALTIIGPSSLVKEIKKDPKKMEVLLG